MVAKTRGGGSTVTVAPKKLQFKDKLVGKGYSTDALLKKLQSLQQELAEMEQERVDVKSLSSVRKELIQVPILLHKDKGVKAYVACCLADILRLYAPDAPYTADELRDIFQFFFSQLSTGLKGTNSPYYNQYFLLLESLSTVKSVVLVCDLPQADDLMAKIFHDLFMVVRNDLAKNIELCMSDILVALIDECQTVPHTVLETLMKQFIDQNARMDQPAYRLAVEVCNATVDKLQRYVCQYFTDIIVQHSKDDDDFAEIRTAHDLIKQIHRDCPSLLHNVVPQLEEELKVSEYEIRLLATQVLGEMFADKSGTELSKRYPHVWEVWQLRRSDKMAGVRIAFVEACRGIITHHPDLRQSIEELLRTKLLDMDDKVRAATCKLYSQLDYETALHHVTETQLRAVGERCMDKKYSVRAEAMQTLGKLYSLARPEIEDSDAAAISQFGWIPEVLLHAAAANNENRHMVEGFIYQFILPLPSKGEDEATWTDQLLSVLRHVDDRAMNVVLNMSNVKQSRPTLFERFVQICEENNGGVIDVDAEVVKRKLKVVVDRLATQFPDRIKAEEDLHSFAKLNEGRLYKLLKICMDIQTDLKTLVKSYNEFLRRVEQASSSIVGTMSVILRKGSLWTLNTSSIPSLLHRITHASVSETEANDADIGDIERYSRIAKHALAWISKHCPALYRPHVAELIKSLAEKNPQLAEVSLQALAAFGWKANEKRTTDRITKYALGASARHAKFAARIIGNMKENEVALNVVNAIADTISKAKDELLVGHLAALAQLVKVVPDAFEQKSDVIVGVLVNDILMKAAPLEGDAMDTADADEWAADNEVSWSTKAKLLAIKICRNRCIVHGGSKAALDVGAPVLTMLLALLNHGGSISEEQEATDDPTVKSRMRLLAATSLVQMASVSAYCDELVPCFALLALTTQDTCFQVRMGFVVKLIGYLSRRKTDMRLNVILFLTAHDPEREVRDKARTYFAYAMVQATPDTKVSWFEMNFIRLIQMLAHHPDFSFSVEQLKEMAKYIEFYLDLSATADNISLLYHLAMKGKTIRDVLPQFDEVMKTIYLPAENASWLSELGKTVRSPNAKTKTRPKTDVKTGRKRKSPGKSRLAPAPKKPPKKRRKKDFDDEDEEDEKEEVSEIESVNDKDEAESVVGSEAEDEGDSDSEDEDGKLGRGARGRAKKRAKREAKKHKREKNGK
ncbi:armadillo-type protein [Hysterangium stoloniferum]|nr:armadillo-type protein [Hysterangium stoloniferum]